MLDILLLFQDCCILYYFCGIYDSFWNYSGQLLGGLFLKFNVLLEAGYGFFRSRVCL